jgi:biopolymer transport protein ExbB/TolQ
VALIGTIWRVNGSFDTLDNSEGARLGNVEAGIKNALVWTVLGLVGSIAGIAMVLLSVVKSKRDQ